MFFSKYKYGDTCYYPCIYCMSTPNHCNGTHGSECNKFIPHLVTAPEYIKEAYRNRKLVMYSYNVQIKDSFGKLRFVTYDTSLIGATQRLNKLYQKSNTIILNIEALGKVNP